MSRFSFATGVRGCRLGGLVGAAYRRLKLGCDLRILLEKLPGVLPALPQLVVAVGEECTRLLDGARSHAEVQEVTFLADALVEEDVELGRPERRRDLVLHHAGLDARANSIGTSLQSVASPQVDSHRRVELQCATG